MYDTEGRLSANVFHMLVAKEDGISAVIYMAKHKYLVVASEEGKLHVYRNIEHKEFVTDLPSHTRRITSLVKHRYRK